MCCPTIRDTLFSVFESKPLTFSSARFQGVNVYLAVELSGIIKEEKPDKDVPPERCASSSLRTCIQTC